MMLVGVRFGRGSCPSTRWIRFLITLSVVLPVFLCEWVLVAELYGGAVTREGHAGYGERGPVVALFRVFHVGGERVC